MDTTILEDIGLSNSEIAVYLSLLELGESTSGSIIKHSKINSSVVHRALNSLVLKGLISYIVIGKDRHYQSINPDNLISFIEDKKKRLLTILPELQAKKELEKDRNETEMFVGNTAIFSMLNSLIANGKKGEQYLSFSLIEPHDKPEVVLFYKNFNLRRREKKLAVKVLVNKSVKKIYEAHYTKSLLKKANVRYTSFTFPQGLIIFRDYVIFLNWSQQPMAVRVQNKIMAKQYNEFFMNFYNKEKDAYK